MRAKSLFWKTLLGSARAIHFDFSGSVPEQFLLAPASLFQRWKPAKTKHEQAQKKDPTEESVKKKRRDTAPISDPPEGGFWRLKGSLFIFFPPGGNIGTEGVEPSWVIFYEPEVCSHGPGPSRNKFFYYGNVGNLMNNVGSVSSC